MSLSSAQLKEIRREFPCLLDENKIYADSACMSLKPRSVFEAMKPFYYEHPSCHRRAVHVWGQRTSKAFEEARHQVAKFLNAPKRSQVVFTKNATEALNLVARGLCFRRGDKVVTTDGEHNSNFVMWRYLERKGLITHCRLHLPPQENLDLQELKKILEAGQVRLVSLFSTSHVTGRSLPIKQIVQLCHQYQTPVMVDAAQTGLHQRIDVEDWGADYVAVSFHKLLGPSGTGALYAAPGQLEKLEPLLLGGETVENVTDDDLVFSDPPARYEAGLQDYAGVMGAAEGLRFLEGIGLAQIQEHEKELLAALNSGLRDLPHLSFLQAAPAEQTGALINFRHQNIDSGELSMMLDRASHIMSRSGVHCAHYWYNKYQLSPSLRLSLAFYNTLDEVEIIVKTIRQYAEHF